MRKMTGGNLTVVSHDTKDPTHATYDPLAEAFDWFNGKLFAGKLPHCMLTLRNYGKAHGYFSHQRFGTADGDQADEIALNPRDILKRPLPYALATLVHEMVHQAQAHFGKPSRGGYHNKQWGDGMKAIGLYPSDTGHPGGRETGQRMSHYIIPEGPFAIACAELLTSGFALRWGDLTEQRERKPDESKMKYTCPQCRLNVWGKPNIRVACIDCAAEMVCVSVGVKTDGDFASDDTKVAA